MKRTADFSQFEMTQPSLKKTVYQKKGKVFVEKD